MNDLVDNLQKTVDAAVELYDKLRIVLERKQGALVKCRAEDLAQCTATEQRLVQLAQALNDGRTGTLRALAKRLGLGQATPKLEDVATRVGEPAASRLRERKAELVTVAEQVQQLNRTNALLIKDSIEFIHDVLRKVFAQPHSTIVYGQRGAISPAHLDNGLVNVSA